MCSPVNTRMSPAMIPEPIQPMSPATTGNPRNVNATSENFASELQSFFVLCLMNLVFGSLAMAFGMQFIVTAVQAMAGAGTFQLFPVFQVLLGWAAAVVGLRWILSSAKILKGVTKIRREYRAMERTGAGAIQKVSGETPHGATSGETQVEPLSGVIRKEPVSEKPGVEPLSGAQKALEKPVSGETLKEPVSEETRTGPVSAEALTGLIVRMMAHYRANWKTIWRMNLISTLGGAIFLALGVINIVDGILAWYSPPGYFYLPVFLAPFIAGAINLTIGVVSLRFSSWFRRYARAWDRRLIEASHSEEALKHAMEQT